MRESLESLLPKYQEFVNLGIATEELRVQVQNLVKSPLSNEILLMLQIDCNMMALVDYYQMVMLASLEMLIQKEKETP